MKKLILICTMLAGSFLLAGTAGAQNRTDAAKAAAAKAKSDEGMDKKAAEWVASLNLNDPAKEARVKNVISTHLKTIRDWHNEHPYTTVPAGINPATGNKLSTLDRQVIANSAMPETVHQALMEGLRKDLTEAHLKTIRDWHNEHPYTTVPAGINPATGNKLSTLDRQVIANSAMPETVHQALMEGLRKDLTEAQVEAILDKYTIGKVDFTLKGYKAIVPDLTPEEEATILAHLKQAREQAVDYKNMNQISAIFEIYKTKCEQYLNSNGRNWRQLYRDYVAAAKARKAAGGK